MKPDEKLDIEEILADLENYRPKRRGWTWREGRGERRTMGPFAYLDCSAPLACSVPLPASAAHFGGVDPQPNATITTEIASGRFEDDIRRMRMAAWHGADHIMVIRTAGQSHMDGLIEGTPQGVGGVPITRKQVRAQRKALDRIEDEVGRPINYHSYVSGVAGPEIAVLFAEEGVNGAHQDPQYNVLYRNVNMVRSFVDAAEAKRILAWAGIAQIDGAHNANATARQAWKVMPELLVQHAINCAFSVKVGLPKELVCLSTVPPTAPPAPRLRYDLPYAVAVRELFRDFKMRAQQNTKYMTSSTREATVTHTLDLLISALTSADIQSTITPDEGRNVPWHIYNMEGVDTARQALCGLDGIRELVALRRQEEPMAGAVRELKERAVLFMEEMLEAGGYFAAVEQGMFVDSGRYPERQGDGIVRQANGGVGADSVFERDPDYLAPVTAHFGFNNAAAYGPEAERDPASLVDGCTFEKPEKIVFVDELDPEDNVARRLEETAGLRDGSRVKPEMEWAGDGWVQTVLFLPVEERLARAAALEMGARMGLRDVEAIHVEPLHPAEGTRVEIKGRFDAEIVLSELAVPPEPDLLDEDEIRQAVKRRPIRIVAATVGEDEHSVGLREILDIKHGGVEGFGIECHYLGTSVPLEKLVDAAVEYDADAILASMIISHDDIHYRSMRRLHELAVEKGVRQRLALVCGGSQVSPELAVRQGVDAGFGRGTKGRHVASFLVRRGRRPTKRGDEA